MYALNVVKFVNKEISKPLEVFVADTHDSHPPSLNKQSSDCLDYVL